MVEVIVVLLLWKRGRQLGRTKGYRGSRFAGTLILAWFVSEIIGILIGIMIFDGGILAYAVGFLAAMIGTVATWNRLSATPNARR